MAIPERLKIVRESLGNTQEEMAVNVGVSKRAWQTYEEGISTPGGKVFAALTRLGFNSNWALTGEGPMKIEDQPLVVTQTAEPAGKDTNRAPDGDIDLAAGLQLLGKIYSSGDQVLIRAINSNLRAFGDAIDDKSRANKAIALMGQMEKRVAALEKKLAAKDDPGDLEDQRIGGAG